MWRLRRRSEPGGSVEEEKRLICERTGVRPMLRSLLQARRPIRMASEGTPGDLLRLRIGERERARRRPRDPARDEFFVQVPESASWLDTASMPMILTAVAVALFAKVLMMYDESKAQERLERKIQKAPPGTGTVRMLTREEWDEIQEIRPRTPFESKLARPNARIRTGESVTLEDVKNWAVDVFADALTRAEESVKQR
ncbi:uncharacterized protein [Elaeis guineensis]|uniref:Uncharacterized protein LOC105060739 isoform X1 n=1 Tax=Elaeis guineensis var. tenera TaxID=51953 RepID=A0A6I9SGA9_ELAGV|nr:uncharacterized protein LOC105060739 isoform X1 [Elaeis guineensis]